jgi:hypothetical protein
VLPGLKAGEHTLTVRGRSDDFSVVVDFTLAVEAA